MHEEQLMNSLLSWILNLLRGMGDALFHPYRDNEPPAIGYQPYTGIEYRNKRIAI